MTSKGTTARAGQACAEASAEELAGWAAWEAQVRTEEALAGGSDGELDWDLVAEVDQILAASGAGEGWVDPAQELVEGLGAAGRGLGRAAVGGEDLVRVFDEGVEAALEAAGRVRCQLTGVTVGLAFEAWGRGLHTAVELSLVDWLRVRCPWLAKQEACQIQDVVRAGDTHWGKPLLEAVVDGLTGVHRAAKVARTMRRLVGCEVPPGA